MSEKTIRAWEYFLTLLKDTSEAEKSLKEFIRNKIKEFKK
jgi:hypothetical protein